MMINNIMTNNNRQKFVEDNMSHVSNEIIHLEVDSIDYVRSQMVNPRFTLQNYYMYIPTKKKTISNHC